MADKLLNGRFLKGAPQNQYIDAESAYKLKIQAEFPGSKMCKLKDLKLFSPGSFDN